MAELTFEEALKKLERIVADLENGDLPLEESLERYEEGIRLSKVCARKLEAVKRKVEILTKSDDGSFAAVPFDEAAAAGEEPKETKRKRSA